MLPIRLYLENYEDIFMERVSSIVTKLDNYNERDIGAVTLFIEYLNVNICKFKKRFYFKS